MCYVRIITGLSSYLSHQYHDWLWFHYPITHLFQIALIHLDRQRLPWGLAQLIALNGQWHGITDLFITYTDDREVGGERYTFANRTLPASFPGVRLRKLNRGTLNGTNAIHSEFGLGRDASGQTVIFGDMLTPHIGDLLTRDINITLAQTNTNTSANDYSRNLFHTPYTTPNILPPGPWPEFAQAPQAIPQA